MDFSHTESSRTNAAIIEHWMASGALLPSQQPAPSDWSREKQLAAAVLTTTLLEVRDRHDDPAYGKQIAEDLDWIHSDEAEWPFSFLRLCEVFALHPSWVRGAVEAWRATPATRPQRATQRYRQAA
jgi:hypothetical protein